MSASAILARYGARTENLIDRLRGRNDVTGPLYVEPYIGYQTPDGLIVRGRVLSRSAHRTDADTAVTGFIETVQRFLTDEVAGVTVTAFGQTTQTDEEGHFALTLPQTIATTPDDGWTEVAIHLPDHDTLAELPVRLTPDSAACGIISDIDDTMMRTEAWSLARNLFNSLTGTLDSRIIFEDARAVMDHLSPNGRNPVFYVSSSPWNLHAFLEAVFSRASLPRGPKFLRDYGLDETRFIVGTHGDHKGSAIDQILVANPSLDFVLMGDTGQHDAEVYLHAIERHPGRIREVRLRHAGPIDERDDEALAKLLQTGVPVRSAPTLID